MFFYQLCGLRLASEIELPELFGWEDEPTGAADVEFRLGPVTVDTEPTFVARGFQLHGDNVSLWMVPDIGTFMVSDGRRIMVEPAAGTSELNVRSALIGRIQAALWLQRGLISIHASSVLRMGRAICLAGPSGAGKSVVSALLAERGLRIIADDMSVLDRVDDKVWLLPGYDSLRLWDDVGAQLRSGRRSESVDVSGRKSIVRFGAADRPGRTEVSDLVLLDPRGGAFSMARYSEVQLLRRWAEVVHLPVASRALGRMPQIVAVLHALVASGARIWCAKFPDSIEASRDAVGTMLETMDQAL